MLQYDPSCGAFADYVEQAVGEIGGFFLFNTRLDDDAYQRCVGALVAPGEIDETVTLVFLARDGRHVQVEDARESRHPIAEPALETPLHIGLHWPDEAD